MEKDSNAAKASISESYYDLNDGSDNQLENDCDVDHPPRSAYDLSFTNSHPTKLPSDLQNRGVATGCN